MPRGYEYAVVDAFASEAYTGNPAGVVLDATGLTDEQMTLIAREFNLSETAFVLPSDTPDAALRLRWFTPSAEVTMCGHATLAAAHALVESGRFAMLLDEPNTVLPIQTLGGYLRVRMQPAGQSSAEHMLWLDLAPPKLSARSLNLDKLARLLGIDSEALDEGLPVMQTQDDDVLVIVRDCPTLLSIQPDFAGLREFSHRQRVRGFCVATVNALSPAVHVQSRFFAPAVGIDEDPVTGSVQGPLATYLVVNELVARKGNKAALSCIQSAASGRAGLVRALVECQPDQGYRVRIGGPCVTTMRGKLKV